MKITGIIRYEGKVHVGVNIRVPEKVKHNAGMIVLALLCRTISWIVSYRCDIFAVFFNTALDNSTYF